MFKIVFWSSGLRTEYVPVQDMFSLANAMQTLGVTGYDIISITREEEPRQ